MNYTGLFLVLCLFLMAAGCLTDSPKAPGASGTPQVMTLPVPAAGQDPLVGIWRISNSQGYDDRYRFNADGTYSESFFDVSTGATQIHTGTWSVQGPDTYTISDKSTGKSRALAYDPARRSIHFVALPHLILTPYTGEIAPGVIFTTAIPATAPTMAAVTSSAPNVPIPSPLTFRGVGNNMVYFDTKAPGKVKFKIYYNISEGEDLKCTQEVTRFQLAGTSVDTSLYYGKVYQLHDAVHTFNLIAPGRYSITIRGCWGWNILVDNA